MPENTTITMHELRVGMYVYLDLKWFEHPFAFSHFRIKTEEQIAVIRSLGLNTVRYSQDLSDMAPPSSVPPLPAAPQAVTEPPAQTAMSELSPALIAKRAMIERIREQREAAARVERAFIDTANTVRAIEKDMFTKPVETVHNATQLIEQITDSILATSELAIHVMGDKMGGEEMYFHSLNVTMLSMIIARAIDLPKEVVAALGMGGLFHDIGRKEIPDKILLTKEPLTDAEFNFYQMHCHYGDEIGQRLHLAPSVLRIIREHHELFDGSGYPKKLKGDAIGLLSRIVVIANRYDELCNPLNIADAMTPHEALSLMFAKQRNMFDPKLLQIFIRCLGVYPPGTVVQLSNGVIGMIATINTSCPTKPIIILYDADIPKREAILLDMAGETDINIVKALKPVQVPREVYQYLSPRKRVSYYFDAANPVKNAAPA